MSNNISNNLFNYATSELSQDAFICYLCSFAIKGNDSNKILYRLALEFINCMLPEKDRLKEGDYLDEKDPICKQYKCIDVLLHVKGYSVLIEDKTYTNTHGDQISRYEKCLIDEGVHNDRIIKVYYKIIEQPYPENGVDFEFNRKYLLDLLSKYIVDCNDKIIVDYYNYLRSIDDSVNMYKTVPIDEWGNDWRCYIGLFNELQKNEIIISADGLPGWGYVPNQKGGFMGFWWKPFVINEIYNRYRSECYLQIENNIIVFKISNDEIEEEIGERIEEDRKNNMKTELLNLVKSYSKELILSKRISINRDSVSICHIEYDETNYKEKISLMQDFILYIKKYFDKDTKGIIFDTNQTNYPNDELEMLKQRKIWAKGTPQRYLKSFNKGDYVLYYAKGDGIFAIGEIIDDEPEVIDNGNGLARNVRFICPDEKYLLDKEKQANIYPKDLKHILNKNFYFASTIKSPFLNVEECKKLIDTLKGKYRQ